MLPRSVIVILLIGFSCLSPGFSQAAVRHWSGGVFGGGQFTDPGSWHDAVPTNSTTSDSAVFFGFLAGPVYRTVNLSVERSVRGLGFLPPGEFLGSPVNFTFTGSKLTIGDEGITFFSGAGSQQTFNNPVGLASGTNQLWDIGPNHLGGPLTLQMNGPLSGSGSINKFGNGTLHLTASNSNTGDINISEGTVRLTGNGRISDKSDVDVSFDGVLWLDGMTDAINGLTGNGIVDLTDGATLVVGNSINDSQGIGDFTGLIRGQGYPLDSTDPKI